MERDIGICFSSFVLSVESPHYQIPPISPYLDPAHIAAQPDGVIVPMSSHHADRDDLMRCIIETFKKFFDFACAKRLVYVDSHFYFFSMAIMLFHRHLVSFLIFGFLCS